VIHEPDGTITLPGSFPVHELVDLDVTLPEGDYTTISGLVLDALGHFPDVGETVTVEGWKLTITSIERHRIQRVTVRRPVPAPTSDD